MTKPAATLSKKARRKAGERGIALKWLVVLAALSIATVLDGLPVSNLTNPVAQAVISSEQAAITLPADRCGPGCTIMMASNQSVGGRFQ